MVPPIVLCGWFSRTLPRASGDSAWRIEYPPIGSPESPPVSITPSGVPRSTTGNGMAELDATMRALRSRTRREILARIWDRDLSAGEIAATFALTGATISEHLAVLRRAGLVEMTKVGTSRRYRAKPAALAGLP